jgi:hypothetical protein
MEVIGKLSQRFQPTGGISNSTGKNWRKMDFLIEKKGKFPSILMLSTFSDQVINFIEDTRLGTELTCSIDVSSREWNGKYFTEARCFKVETNKSENTDYYPQKEKAKVEENFQTAEETDLPF